MLILMVVIFVILVLLGAVRPHQSKYSEFERQRRALHSSDAVRRELLRHETYSDVMKWIGLKETLLTVALVLLLIAKYGLALGLMFGVLAIIGYRIFAQISLLRKLAQKLYDTYELPILRGINKLGPIARLIYGKTEDQEVSLASREELAYLIEQAGRFLDDKEHDLMSGALEFYDRKVRDHMIPRNEIETVAIDELLGPLVLDDLHKTGHSQFPVVDGDIDHIVGILDIDRYLVASEGRSSRTKDAMDDRVYYIHETETLEAALAAYVKTKQNLLVVVGDDQKTAGLLSLGDVMSVLLGGELADSSDDHDSLRAVADRNLEI